MEVPSRWVLALQRSAPLALLVDLAELAAVELAELAELAVAADRSEYRRKLCTIAALLLE